MEVSHVNDHVTHAVIGGGENISFGISDSAEFFNILSSTLYKDQYLAVIREVLCNAWDAHIAAGKQGIPVTITLTNEEFVIRDYGSGIPHELIGPIYTVYGNSTKKHDGKQTGGFGLGCKAPFAYTDHFEVISWSQGQKSVYNVSKSAAEVMGKPGMKLIQQFPCGTETGLQVRIKLKTSYDRSKFYELIKMITRNGDMNIELNKEALPRIPFGKMQLDFLITGRPLTGDANQHILLRYGNVIYPITQHESYCEVYKQAKKIIDTLGGGMYSQRSYYLVLQAPPHSISVTPSREELSMQEHTIKTLDKLLNVWLDRFHKHYRGEVENLLEECIDRVWKEKKYNELLTEDKRIPGNVVEHLTSDNVITTIPSLVRYHAAREYPKGYRQTEIIKRLNVMIEGKWGNLGLLQSYRALVQLHGTEAYPQDMKWFHDHIVSPLTRRMANNDMMDPSRLLVLGWNVAGGDYRLTSSKSSKEMLQPVTALTSIAVERMWPFIRNIVVISYTRGDVAERLRSFPEIRDQGGGMNYGLMVYIVPRNSDKAKAAKDYFNSLHGVKVIDLTVAAAWESKEIADPAPRVYTKRKKQVGWPSIKSIINKYGSISMELGRSEDAARIEKPEWYTFLTTKTKSIPEPQSLDRFNKLETMAILELFGSTGAICLSKIQEEKLKEAGALPIADFVRDKVIEYVSESEPICAYFQEHSEFVHMRDRGEILEMVCHVQALRDHFQLGQGTSMDDRRYLRLWEDVKSYCLHGWRNHKPAEELNKAIEEHPTNPLLLKARAVIEESDMLPFIDTSYMKSALNGRDANLRKKALDLFITAINS